MTDRNSSIEKSPIAIIGMSCRLPGASTPAELWRMLIEGRCALRSIEERWKKTLIRPSKHELDPPVPRAGLLEDIQSFDAGFFGISPREAERMDPQQRLLLEVVWEAFEDAGVPPERYAGDRVGVFTACSGVDYWASMLDSAHRADIDGWTNLGGSASITANRISYLFDFRGPSVAIDTACSSSLFAVHLARRSLMTSESRVAIVAGANLLIRPEVTLGFSRANMLSPTGNIRPFGSGANGYVRGEGVACALLKRLDDALRDGDTIHAVIAGSAVSQDGRTPGITVPSARAQAEMLELAYADAGIDPRTVRYVEAHGTGTPVGDPIETRALAEVIGAGRQEHEHCWIGSLKSNIGHLESAAGLAGLIKVVLCLEQERIPPTLVGESVNPSIPFAEMGLRVATQEAPLAAGNQPVVAGINASGFGGTNAHVVLQSFRKQGRPQDQMREDLEVGPCLIPLSGRQEQAVRDQATQTATLLGGEPTKQAADVSHTYALRRSAHPYRAFSIAEDATELMAELQTIGRHGSRIVHAENDPGPIAVVFSGMGPQFPGMGRTLLRFEPTFRESVEHTDALFSAVSGWSILERVLEAAEADLPSLVERADLGHPAHFALQMGLFDLFTEWGIEWSAVIGHSAGEVSAACASGLISREDAVRVLYHRSRLVQRFSGSGRMLAIAASRVEAEAIVNEYRGEVCIAAFNSPESIALSGPERTLEEIAARIQRDDRFARLIPGSFPYHSPIFEPMRDEFISALRSIEPSLPEIPLLSTVTGTWTDARSGGSADYWWRNVREPVAFEAATRTALVAGHRTFIEIGARPALLRSIRESAASTPDEVSCIETLQLGRDDRASVLRVGGELWARGHHVDLASLVPDSGTLTALPTYRWQRQPYWIRLADRDTGSAHPVRGERTAADLPIWQSSISATNPSWAKDHRILGQIVVPGAAYIEAWLSAALESGAVFPVGLANVRFSDIRALNEESVFLRTKRTGIHWTCESSASLQQPAWKVHASAEQIQTRTTERSVLDLDGLRSSLLEAQPDYALFSSLGYGYGSTFQRLASLWRGPAQALGKLSTPMRESCDGDYLIHPTVLDAALQTVLGALEPLTHLWIPASVEKVTLYRALTLEDGELWAHARVLHVKSEQGSADVVVVDGAGHAVLRLEGLAMKRVGAAIEATHDLYREEWVRSSVPPGYTAPMSLPSRTPADQLLMKAKEAAPQDLAQDSLDALASAYFAEALQSFAGVDPGQPLPSVRTALERGQILERHATLCLRMAARAGDAAADVSRIRRELCESFPAFHLERLLVERFGANLARILTGEASPHELLLGSTDGLGALAYADAETSRPAHRLIRDALLCELAGQSSERGIRILEVGAGTGGLTAWLLPIVEPHAHRTEYVFTDVSPVFLAESAERFRRYAFVKGALLDIQKDPEPQGFDLQSFDLIVASSALHTTSDVAESLRRCASLLRPGGLLLACEPVTPRPWLEMVFGTFEEWWGFTDRTLRPEQPLLSAAQWERVLSDEGYAQVASRPVAAGSPFAVIAARAALSHVGSHRIPAPHLAQRSLLCGGTNAARELANLLGAVNATRVEHAEEAYAALANGSFQRVVYFVQPTLSDPAAVALDLAGLVARLPASSSRFTIVTRYARSLPSDQRLPQPDQALVCGFARVMANEHPDVEIRMIDLGAECEHEASALLQELERAEHKECALEREVALRGNLRFVPVLSKGGAIRSAVSAGSDTAWAARIERPGDLSSIACHPVEVRKPVRNEVQVRVEAHGLNFRDVLQALGLLEERGLPGVEAPGWGSDCAGTVLCVGPSVQNLRVGDRVVGFVPGSLASHVTCSEDLLVPIPAELGMAAAVTLPIVGSTALLALRDCARICEGDTVLIHSGAGALGLACIALARHLGATILATAGNAEKRGWLKALGVKVVMDSRTLGFAEEARAATGGRGVDVVINSLAGEAIEAGLRALAPGGRFIELGKRDVRIDRGVGLGLLARNASIHVADLMEIILTRPLLAHELLSDTFDLVAKGVLKPIPHQTLPIDRLDEAVRLMSTGRHTGKVVVSSADSSPYLHGRANAARPIGGSGSYLITGGVSGFGFATAKWLAARGAKHVTLVSRKPLPTPEVRAQITELELAGTAVSLIAADVSIPGEVTQLIARFGPDLPVLKGIFHAAVVYEDVPVRGLTREAFEHVIAPKVLGTWLLHEATRCLDLDHFVLYSSISRILGTPGQSAYVGASEFMASIASIRRRLGLRATCIDWGMIADQGYLHRSPLILERLKDSGLHETDASAALEYLDQVFDANLASVCPTRIDWQRIHRLIGAGAQHARLRELVASGAGRPTTEVAALTSLKDIQEAESAERRELAAVSFVRARAGAVLRCPSERIDLDTPLIDVGLDSLMEVELRALIQRDARLESVPLEQMRGQSIRAVASHLLERLGFQSAGAAKDRESEPFSVWLREREAALAAAFASGEPALVSKELGKTVDELDVQAAAVAPVDERECRARLRDRLGKFFFQSAFLRRAMDKPFGYPGDFQMMDQIYRNEPSGEGIARIIDGFALARPTAQANRNRVPYIADILRRACPPGTNVRVVSIGCGPAWEARVLAASEPELAARIHLTLVDQEARALAACKAAFAGIAGSFASVRFIEAPIEELATRGSDAQRAITGSDVVYSAGLFDYFNDHNFVVYLQTMYDALKPGGRLMVGNVSPGNPDKRLLEYVTEWILYYRSEPELEVLSRRITPEPAWSAIEVEPLGINYFLVAERPA